MKTEQMALYVLIGATVGALAIFGIMLLFKRKCRPGKCSNIRHSKKEGYSMGWGAGAEPQWSITWTPPTVGTGTGYTVTYSGAVIDSNKKPIYSFSTISDPSIFLPDTTAPGVYTITVTATNQIGEGPAYTQQITLGNHTPQFTGQLGFQLASKPFPNNTIILDIDGVFPDAAANGSTNVAPGSYSTTLTKLQVDGNNQALNNTVWNVTPTHAHFETELGISIQPTSTVTFTWKMCNYDLCTNATWQFSAPISSHYPKFSGSDLKVTQPTPTSFAIQVAGVFPDASTSGNHNSSPGSYLIWITTKMAGENFDGGNWTLIPTQLSAQITGLPWATHPGQKITFTIKACNIIGTSNNFCDGNTWVYTVPGSKPGPSSDVLSRFGV
jgi:hypothetical protein